MTREEARYLLNNLRSVAEGKEDKAIDMAIEALSAEAPSGDLINRADIQYHTQLEPMGNGQYIDVEVAYKDDIDALPSADAVSREFYEDVVKANHGLAKENSELKEQIESADAKLVRSKCEVDHDREWIIGCLKHDGFIHTHRFDKANQIIHEALQNEQRWIPFTRRPMTEEEQKDYPNCTFMFDCVLPDDGDEILISNGRFVWTDVFCNDIDGCYLDCGDDIDEDMAWMPMPKPYKGGDTE